MVKFLGLYDPWGSFLDFAPSVHEAPRACKERTTLRDKATGKGREGVKHLPNSRDERGFCISALDLNALGLEASADYVYQPGRTCSSPQMYIQSAHF